MGKALSLLLVVSILLVGPQCYSQTSAKISEPRLELRDSLVHIYYDIQSSDPTEKYVISIDIKDEQGNPIHAGALAGDIGMVEEGGANKQITWNLEADEIHMDAYIFVKINARVIPPPEPVIIETEEEIVHREEISESSEERGEPGLSEDAADKDGREDIQADDTGEQVEEIPEKIPGETADMKEAAGRSGTADYNRAGLMLQSLALPGLGLSRVTGNPHWLRAVAGYGCLGGAVIFNRKGVNTFNSVGTLEIPEEAEEAFNKSVRQDNISEAFAYTAIGIWVADFVWTWIGTSGLKSGSFSGDLQKVSFGTDFDPQSHVPLVCFRYNF